MKWSSRDVFGIVLLRFQPIHVGLVACVNPVTLKPHIKPMGLKNTPRDTGLVLMQTDVQMVDNCGFNWTYFYSPNRNGLRVSKKLFLMV